MASLERDMETDLGMFPPNNAPRAKTPPSLAPLQVRPHERPLDIGPFTEIPKLVSPKGWHAWHRAISAEFQKQGVWEIVVDDKNVDPKDPPYGLDWPKWKRLDNSLAALLAMTVHRHIMNSVPDGVGGSSLYKHLSVNFKPGPTFSQLLKILAGLHIDNFSSASQYTHKFDDIYRKLRKSRPDAISPVMINALYLEGLGPEWEDLRVDMMEDTAENRRLTPQLVMGMVYDRDSEPDSDASDDDASTPGDVHMKEEKPAEAETPSNKEMPSVEKKPAQEEGSDEDKSTEDGASSDDATLSGQGVPVSKEAVHPAENMPAKHHTPAKQPTPTEKQTPADQEMDSDDEEDDEEDNDESSDSDASSGDDSDMSDDDDVPYGEGVRGTKEVNPPAKNISVREGSAAKASVPAKRKVPMDRQIYDEEDLPSHTDEESDTDSYGSSDEETSDDDEQYSTGETPSKEEKAASAEPARQSNRPFCGHCNVQGHKERGCWRAQGRSEEEITQMRTELNERRRNKRRKVEKPQRPVTPPPNH